MRKFESSIFDTNLIWKDVINWPKQCINITFFLVYVPLFSFAKNGFEEANARNAFEGMLGFVFLIKI